MHNPLSSQIIKYKVRSTSRRENLTAQSAPMASAMFSADLGIASFAIRTKLCKKIYKNIYKYRCVYMHTNLLHIYIITFWYIWILQLENLWSVCKWNTTKMRLKSECVCVCLIPTFRMSLAALVVIDGVLVSKHKISALSQRRMKDFHDCSEISAR